MKVKSNGHQSIGIGSLAAMTGVSPRMLRYYENQRLLRPDRADNGYRRYRTDAPDTVRQIRTLLAAGLSTEVIREVLPCARGDQPALEPCPELLARLATELDGLDTRIEALRDSRTLLSGLLRAARAQSTQTEPALSACTAPPPGAITSPGAGTASECSFGDQHGR